VVDIGLLKHKAEPGEGVPETPETLQTFKDL
jgi:hypothetical protein